MAKTAIDSMGWLVNIILTVLIDPIWNGINRILRGRLFWGIIWIITAGFFGIGWLIDIVTVIVNKKITILA